MDLEDIFLNAGSMDAQNVTILLLGVLAQFGNNKTSLRPAATSDDNGQETNQTTVEDDVVLLALNLSAMLMKYYSNNSALWNAVVANLEKEEIRRKEDDNRLLSPTTSITLISVYVSYIENNININAKYHILKYLTDCGNSHRNLWKSSCHCSSYSSTCTQKSGKCVYSQLSRLRPSSVLGDDATHSNRIAQ